MSTLRQAVQAEIPRALEDLKALARIPSVAAQGIGIAEAVQMLRQLFEAEGARVEIVASAGNPVLDIELAGVSDRSLLFYDHYDVQPAEPLAEWTTPAFEPTVRDGKLFGRGVSDNKGDTIARLAAIRALKRHLGRLPCRVRFLIEGEEEIGSPNLPAVMAEHGQRWRADACIWEFGGKDEAERVLLYGGLKGICYLQLNIRTASVDMHSSVAPLIPNPAWRLVWALSTFKGPDDRVLIEGFYDDVVRPSARSRELAARIPFEADRFRKLYGVDKLLVEPGPDLVEHFLFSPTCTISGLVSGYTGPGSKTVLPKEAQAKIDFRLVPNQSPEDIRDKVRRHLDRQGFSDIEVTLLGPEHPYLTDMDHPFVQLVADTAREAYGEATEVVLYPTAAGSGPMHPIGHTLGVPIISTGIGYYGSRAHAPDENIRLADFEAGAYHMAVLLERFART